MQSHPDADAFVRAYLEQPADTVARLVFADWLEETGEPHSAAWAHFIRAKIETDQHPHDSTERRSLERKADSFAPHIRAKLTITAQQFVAHPMALLQLLPAPNITVRLVDFTVVRPVLELVPESVARENLILPLDAQERTLFIAAVDPRNTNLAQKLGFILNRDIILLGTEREDLQAALDREFGPYLTDVVEEQLVEFDANELLWTSSAQPPPDSPTDFDDVLARTANTPIIRATNSIITTAISLDAQRARLFPDHDGTCVRYRIAGEWVEGERFPLSFYRPIIARLAISAGIDVRETLASTAVAPLIGEFTIRIRPALRVRFRVTIQTPPHDPTTQLDLTIVRSGS